MRKHRHDDVGVQARVHDRSARRQGVGRRPGRRRHDQSVRALVVDEVTVHKQLEVHHSGGGARVHHDIVQRRTGVGELPAANDMGLEQRAFVRRVLPGEHGADLLFDLVRRDVGEEAQAPAVDANDQRRTVREIPGDPEHAAIATDHHDQIAPGTQFPAVHVLVVASGQHRHGVVLQHEFDTGAGEKTRDRDDGVDNIRIADSPDEADRVESSGCGHLCKCCGVVSRKFMSLQRGEPGRVRERGASLPEASAASTKLRLEIPNRCVHATLRGTHDPTAGRGRVPTTGQPKQAG